MKKESRYKIIIGVLVCLIIAELLFIIITRPKKVIKIPVAIKGKIAIVIDDWGYNLNDIHLLEQIKFPLTISILPNLHYSRQIAEQLQGGGFELILHLPMEPYEKYRLEENTILTSLDEPTIIGIIKRDLANVPYVVGVSNHMGSKATRDLKTMEIIFKELKKRHLYFLDSFVTSKSICADLARKMHLAFAKRDVFLDNEQNPKYIKRQIYKLKNKARAYGQAIGIGHDRKVTLAVLKEIMPELEKEGYKFVYVSELVNPAPHPSE